MNKWWRWVVQIENNYFRITPVHLKWNNRGRRSFELLPSMIIVDQRYPITMLAITGVLREEQLGRVIFECWRLRCHNRFIATIPILRLHHYNKNWIFWWHDVSQCLFNATVECLWSRDFEMDRHNVYYRECVGSSNYFSPVSAFSAYSLMSHCRLLFDSRLQGA